MLNLNEVCTQLDEMFGADEGTAMRYVFKRLERRNQTAFLTKDCNQDAWTLRRTSNTTAVIEKHTPGVSFRDEVYSKWTVGIAKYSDGTRARIAFCLNAPSASFTFLGQKSRPSKKTPEITEDKTAIAEDKKGSE